jgi:hypothetical protein
MDALEALDPIQRTEVVLEEREISELMNGLTELNESIRDQDRGLAALGDGGNEEATEGTTKKFGYAGWLAGGWVGVLGFRPAAGVGGWVRKMVLCGFLRGGSAKKLNPGFSACRPGRTAR